MTTRSRVALWLCAAGGLIGLVVAVTAVVQGLALLVAEGVIIVLFAALNAWWLVRRARARPGESGPADA